MDESCLPQHLRDGPTYFNNIIAFQPAKKPERSAWLSFVDLPWMTDIVMPGFHVIFRGFSSPHETGPTPLTALIKPDVSVPGPRMTRTSRAAIRRPGTPIQRDECLGWERADNKYYLGNRFDHIAAAPRKFIMGHCHNDRRGSSITMQ